MLVFAWLSTRPTRSSLNHDLQNAVMDVLHAAAAACTFSAFIRYSLLPFVVERGDGCAARRHHCACPAGLWSLLRPAQRRARQRSGHAATVRAEILIFCMPCCCSSATYRHRSDGKQPLLLRLDAPDSALAMRQRWVDVLADLWVGLWWPLVTCAGALTAARPA